jgi:subtilisin family serine protease
MMMLWLSLKVPKIVGKLTCFAIGPMLIVAFLLISSPARAEEYEPGQIIVKFTPDVGKVDVQYRDGIVCVGIASLDQRLARYAVGHIAQLFPHKSSELGMIYRLDFDPRHDAHIVAGDFARDEHLLYAVTRQIKRLCTMPNDAYYLTGEQWYLNAVRGPQAWDTVRGDSSVIIAIVDTGVDWDHPDLWDNIWINPGEDLDGDGYITFLDWNNVDDEGNGYVDDFFGWDFGGANQPDNDPNEHAPIHGTHCAGIAAAVTNNGFGVAGMSWNCKIMSVKAMRDGDDGISFGYKGILYAADNGADVISLSWGNLSTSAYEQEVIDSASARGAIIVAAAGNDPPCSPPQTPPVHYPAGNDHVIAVAATDIGDRATGWTYYGDWVDVAAPGLDILSTWYDDSFARLQGTSMSCPLVAGVAGLMKTLDPEMTSDEFELKMHYTSDDISHINPRYTGWLGGGRVNAYASVLSMTAPRLVVEDVWTIEDAEGNGDARPDAGETVDWIVTLTNLPAWQLAQDVGVKVATADETIIFLQDSTSLGDIESGSSADNAATPFRFSVATGTKAHWTTFFFEIEAEGGIYGTTDSLQMMVGRPEVLIVDDDGGDDQEGVYQADLEALSVIYDIWEVAGSGKISAEELAHYRVTIWLTGAEMESTLTVQDQDHLSLFLEAGNRLFLTGENIGDEIGDSPFFSDYVHVAHVADTVSFLPPELEGVPGDTVSDGALLFLWGETGPLRSPSAIESIDGSVDIFTYLNDPEHHVAGTRYESPQGYKLVYFAFGYKGIREAAHYTSGRTVLERILSWFDVELEPVSVDQDQTITDRLPRGYALAQNYPNPFNAETSIDYALPAGTGPQRTILLIYNNLGQKVRTLVDQVQEPGAYSVYWDGRDETQREVSSSVYFYRLQSGTFDRTRKMVLLR